MLHKQVKDVIGVLMGRGQECKIESSQGAQCTHYGKIEPMCMRILVGGAKVRVHMGSLGSQLGGRHMRQAVGTCTMLSLSLTENNMDKKLSN